MAYTRYFASRLLFIGYRYILLFIESRLSPQILFGASLIAGGDACLFYGSFQNK